MESKPEDELKKRRFIEGLRLELKRKMKIVSPSSHTEAYNRAIDLESEQKMKKKKKSSSSDSDDSSSEEDSTGDEKDSKKV